MHYEIGRVQQYDNAQYETSAKYAKSYDIFILFSLPFKCNIPRLKFQPIFKMAQGKQSPKASRTSTTMHKFEICSQTFSCSIALGRPLGSCFTTWPVRNCAMISNNFLLAISVKGLYTSKMVHSSQKVWAFYAGNMKTLVSETNTYQNLFSAVDIHFC